MPSSGRNLPAATLVALGLLTVVVASVAWRPEPFALLVAVAVGLSVWELRAAFAHAGIDLPLWPLLVGNVGIQLCSYSAGLVGAGTSAALTAVAVVAWRAIDGVGRGFVRDAMASVFGVVYLGLLPAFIVLVAMIPGDGRWLALAAIALPVANDTGGYAVGAWLGHHKLAPSISPKKSWEGLGGSIVLACGAGAGAALALGHAWWLGLVFGALAVATSTLGDLAESLLKRDLGIKDMGSLLPGHGGVLDRVDSIVMTAPFAYAVLAMAL